MKLILNRTPVSPQRFFAPDTAFAYERIPVDLARITIDGPVDAEIQLPPSVAVSISSLEGMVKKQNANGTVSFQVHPFSPVAVKAEGYPLLLIKPEAAGAGTSPEGAVIFEKTGDEQALQCEAINAAMRALSDQGGGTLSLSPGLYPIATLSMQSHVTLHLQEGAVLQATLDVEAYPTDPPGTLYEDLPRSLIPGPRRRVIYWHDCEHAALTGCGLIVGQGSEFRRQTVGTPQGRPLINLMKFVHARHCRIEGVTLADSEFWNTHVSLSEHITFDQVAVINERPPREWASYLGDHAKSWFWNNTDGINPDSSQHVEIRHCLLHTGDDCVAVKNTGTYRNELQDIEDIQVHHNLMVCNTTPMKIGTETRGGRAKSVHFHHNTVAFCSRMFAAELKDGLTVEDLRVENITVVDCNRPFDLEIIPRQDEKDQTVFSHLNGAVLKNINIRRYRNEGENWQSHLRGRDHEHVLQNVTLENIRFGTKSLEDLGDPDLVLNEFTDGITLS